jgi:hypothetical protein
MLVRGEIVDILEVDEGGVGLLVVAGGAGVVDGEVDFQEIAYVEALVLCLKMTKERIKRVRAKIADSTVQRQSVHLRSFSYTGKFRNVYTLFLNIYPG